MPTGFASTFLSYQQQQSDLDVSGSHEEGLWGVQGGGGGCENPPFPPTIKE